MRALIACLLLVLAMPATAMDGVDVGKPSAVRNLVPAGALVLAAHDCYGGTCRLLNASRSDDNPNGFTIEGFTIIENKDLQTIKR